MNYNQHHFLGVILLMLVMVSSEIKQSSAQFFVQQLELENKQTMVDSAHWNNSIPCLTCHVLHGTGAQLTTVEGNANLCMSCHNPVGMASITPFSNADKAIPGSTGTSHSWNVPALNPDFGANYPLNQEMAKKVMNGEIVCSTCHQPHFDYYPPYLRTSNNQDALCKDCHSVRDVGTYADDHTNRGSHPVGEIYPSSDARFYSLPQDPNILLIGSNVECMSCHGVHYASSGNANSGTGDGYLLRTTNNDNLCTSCHTYGTHQGIGCLTCHQIHNTNQANILMIRDSIVTPSSGLRKVVFTSESGSNSFAGGDALYDGICEVCHTSTNYYRNNANGNHTHNLGLNCVMCHLHDGDFAPQGNCVDCHSLAQDNGDGIPVGGRRAVTGEFPSGSAHAHYGATLDEDDCLVCHSITNHGNGNIDLIDADNGSILSFITPDSIHSDPDVSNFCQSCHDLDGALLSANPFDPFNSGHPAPDVATRFMGTLQWNEWFGDFCFGSEGTLRGVNSHHDISDADQAFSGAKLECLNCHGPHTASAEAPLADPYYTTSLWSGTNNEFCLSCHNGGIGPADPGFPDNVKGSSIALRGLDNCNYMATPWYVDYTWTNSAHGNNSKRGWQGYSGAPAYEVLCLDCHDPHGSYAINNQPGNPYMIRDTVDGTAYIDDGVRPGSQWTGPPWNTYGINRPVKIPVTGTVVDWGGAEGLCNVCHADWLNAYDWHSYCNACQTCHGHGASWENHDWGGGGNSVPCGTKSANTILDSNQWHNPTLFHINQVKSE